MLLSTLVLKVFGNVLELTRREWAKADQRARHILVADVAEAKIMCKDFVEGE